MAWKKAKLWLLASSFLSMLAEREAMALNGPPVLAVLIATGTGTEVRKGLRNRGRLQ